MTAAAVQSKRHGRRWSQHNAGHLLDHLLPPVVDDAVLEILDDSFSPACQCRRKRECALENSRHGMQSKHVRRGMSNCPFVVVETIRVVVRKLGHGHERQSINKTKHNDKTNKQNLRSGSASLTFPASNTRSEFLGISGRVSVGNMVNGLIWLMDGSKSF